MEQNTHVDQIKRKIENDLCIKRVPKNQLQWFKEYAKEEFEGDYGMLLRELIQFYKGMYAETMLLGLDLVDKKLDSVVEVVNKIDQKSALKPTNKVRTMANGRELRTR